MERFCRFRTTCRQGIVLAALVLIVAGCSARESRASAAPPAPASPQAPPSTQPPSDEKSDAIEKAQVDSKETQEKKETEEKGEAATPKEKLSTVETVEEHQENLDEKLDSSLREFDSLLLREQEILEERRETSAASGGGGGAGQPGTLPGVLDESEGGDGAAGGARDGGDRSGARAEAGGGTGGSPDRPPGDAEPDGSGAGAPVGGDPGELSNGRIPPDVGDGSDDDIVARQLREAAMNEDDPELREKLWDEYRAYKFGTDGAKGGDAKKKKN